ncbi:MAG TPA: hypothetical protein VFQ65_16140, partial [Kofleriaceae bacterium]|nr:hypothetical protein [Kofleriaceae bacterium]
MSNEHNDVVEIDAIAVEEWDRDQHTPRQVESNLAELVKKSGLDSGWDAGAKDEAAAAIDKPRTTTNTMRRTASAPAIPSKVHKTMAMPTVAAVKPAAPAATKPAQPQAPAQAQPKPKLEAKSSTMKSATKTTATRVALQPATTIASAKPAKADATPAPIAKPAPKSAPVAAKTATPAVTVGSTKPAKADATPAPAAPIAKAEAAKSAPVAAKTSTPAVASTKPAKADATPPPAPIAKPATASASPNAAPAPAMATPALAPSALDLPAWPPAPSVSVAPLEVAPRGSAPARQVEDWDEMGGTTSVGNHDHAQEPPRKPGEDSVIVDLDAVSKTEREPSRRPQTYPILTSEQGTTTSGAFVMPTAAQPQASQPAERPTSPSMPVAMSATSGAAASSSAWHTPLPLAPPPPEPAPQWPSAAGLEYNGAHGSEPEIPLPVSRHEPTESRLERRTLLATVFPTPTSRKKGLLAAAGAVAVILVIVLVSAGGGSTKSVPD